jgi:hypothetical protein
MNLQTLFQDFNPRYVVLSKHFPLWEASGKFLSIPNRSWPFSDKVRSCNPTLTGYDEIQILKTSLSLIINNQAAFVIAQCVLIFALS